MPLPVGVQTTFGKRLGTLLSPAPGTRALCLSIEINQRCVRGFHASFNCLRCKDMCVLFTFPNLQR